MQVIVNKEINYVEDANALLYNYVNSISYEKLKTEGLRKINYSIELYEKKYRQIIHISDYVIDNLRIDKNKLEFYFKELGNSKLSISVYLLPLLSDYQYKTLKEYKNSAQGKENSEIIKGFYYLISQQFSMGDSGEENIADNLEDIIRYMDKAEMSAEDKWKIIQAYLDREKHLEELCNILDRAVLLIKERDDEVEALEKEFYDYWSQYISNNDFIKELQEYVNFTWRFNKEGIYIIPTIFRPNNILLNINDDEEDKKADIIYLGVVLDSNLSVNPTKIDSEVLNNSLKLLSDKSKFEILSFIKDKPAYGFEIANELNLSTSTISYHMSGLISAGLVKLEKDANKIYYSINKETLNKILDDIRSLLL